jgi:thymidylate kinase
MTTVVGSPGQRTDVVAAVERALSGFQWAWQGPDGAVDAWTAANDAKDLDIWCADGDVPGVRAAIEAALPASRIEQADDPRRLRHTGWAVFTPAGLAVVDITFGDLRVGPLLLCPADLITTSDHRLTGVAAAADLLVRPLLRGRIPEDARIAQARAAWQGADEVDCTAIRQVWQASLGPLCVPVLGVLEGGTPSAGLATRARRWLLRRTVAPSNAASAWRQRHSIVPAGKRSGPLGHRVRGVVVALVGTDGSGKSTVAGQIAQGLQDVGVPTHDAYFGMARGNLPGVNLARKVLGIATPGGEDRSGDSEDKPASAPGDHQTLRKVAAWYYAVEYGWRYLSIVAPARRRGEVVLCDRYVYDLRDSPWPGSPAAAFAQRLVPRPDILVLPDAPIEMIHARKPERTLAEQAEQQQKFRDLLAEQPGSFANLVVDTSGATNDPAFPVVRAVLSCAHLGRRRSP